MQGGYQKCSHRPAYSLGLFALSSTGNNDVNVQLHGLSDGVQASGVQPAVVERHPEEEDVGHEAERAAGREEAGGEGAGGACRCACVGRKGGREGGREGRD